MEKVFKYSIKVVKTRKFFCIFFALLLFAFSAVVLLQCCLYQNTNNFRITISVTSIGSSFPLFFALFLIRYRRRSLNAILYYININSADIAEEKLFFVRKSEEETMANYLVFKKIYFANDNGEEKCFLIPGENGDVFVNGSIYATKHLGDVLIEYEKK